MLALDDPRWVGLDHRNWSDGRPGAADAPFVPDELRLLRANPGDRARFDDLWPYLCSEDTPWPAAYAAVPHLVDIARGLAPAERGDYLIVTGFVVACSGGYGRTPAGVPEDVADEYRAALPEALRLLTEQLTAQHGGYDTRYLLAATAALKGHTDLAELLYNLDAQAECESCGEPVFELAE